MTPGVVRIGDTVHRPFRRSPALDHALLRYLDGQGFDGTHVPVTLRASVPSAMTLPAIVSNDVICHLRFEGLTVYLCVDYNLLRFNRIEGEYVCMVIRRDCNRLSSPKRRTGASVACSTTGAVTNYLAPRNRSDSFPRTRPY